MEILHLQSIKKLSNDMVALFFAYQKLSTYVIKFSNLYIYTTYIFAELTPTLVPITPKLSKIEHKGIKAVSR